jgi:hypothetical protein
MVDFLIPVNNVQMAICDNLVSVMKNVFCGRGLGVWSNPNGKKFGVSPFFDCLWCCGPLCKVSCFDPEVTYFYSYQLD